MPEEIKPENNIPKQEAPSVPDEFKVAEIWIKKGMIHLEAARSFWDDRVRAVGLLEYCKDIVKNAQAPKAEKPKIITNPFNSTIDFVRNGLRKKR